MRPCVQVATPLRSYSIFALSRNARNDSCSKSPCARLSAPNFKTVPLLQTRRVTLLPKLISFSSVANFLNTSVENLVNFACNFCIAKKCLYFFLKSISAREFRLEV